MTKEVRVRFAPSPTGYLHVGGARTALFNWLFARHHQGKFILRIEDTDYARSSEEMVEGILQGLRWLGIDWDEGPFSQSQRLSRYSKLVTELLERGCAYRCFCTPADLAARKSGPGKEQAWLYDRRCLTIDRQESENRAQAGESFAVRFSVPPGKTAFKDHVFGEIEVENTNIEDFVLQRSDGAPTYHLGVVVDDLDMRITHIIRGADHISNTPKQILIYRAVGEALPEFAHLPLILGPDKQRLSKRHGATSVTSYAEMGYLPEAFFNFLSLLGWSPGDDREILSRAELIELFSLDGVGKANAIFGLEKLDWFNNQYIRNAAPDVLRRLVTEELRARQIWPQGASRCEPGRMDAILELLKSRARRLSDFGESFRAFFTDDFAYDTAAAAKFLTDSKLKELLVILLGRYQNSPSFTLESVEADLRRVAEEASVKAGLLINALRVGLTGQGVAPRLFDVMLALGRDATLARLRRLIEHL
jgi:glutamyl-tRNA synthetase